MRVYEKPMRFPTEGQSSINHNIPYIQLGHAVTPANDATLWIPCDIDEPVVVNLTALDSDTKTRLSNSYQTNNNTIETLATVVADTSYAWAASTAYVVGQLVVSDSKVYACIEAHTSASAFATDLASIYWKEVNAKGFIKITVTAASSVKVNVAYEIIGF